MALLSVAWQPRTTETGGDGVSGSDVGGKPEVDSRVDQEFVRRQKLVWELVQNVSQNNTNYAYFKVGTEYDLAASLDNYTNKTAVEEFMAYDQKRARPKGFGFSVFNERMRKEAIDLYDLFYYAKDFDTFYKTAAWARVRLNNNLVRFIYAYTVAIIHRPDTQNIVLPAPYEIYPFFFINSEVVKKLYYVKMQEGLIDPTTAAYYGIFLENNTYTVYANYSGSTSFDNKEQKLSYFTEDIGLNTYYYYYHVTVPFWMSGNEITIRFGDLKERRGEVYWKFHQQLLARYYMERLSNGMGEISQLSWRRPVATGYTPNLVMDTLKPFSTRNNFYDIQNNANIRDIENLESYEDQFLEYLRQGKFNSYGLDIDLSNDTSIKFVGNYWQSNADLNEKSGLRKFQIYYEILARTILGATPAATNPYYAAPAVLEQFQTALRDPVFYQLYKRVMYFFLQYKKYLQPYDRNTLNFDGVKITEVTVGLLVTFFDFFTFEVNNVIQHNPVMQTYLQVRQSRLNQKAFDVNIEIASDVASDAVIKIFLGPKYDSNGHPISMEENWMNFIELDTFKHRLNPGNNTIVRSSEEFINFKNDSLPSAQWLKMLDSGVVPKEMSEDYYLFPRRLMLPKGTSGGFPFQMYFIVYPWVAPAADSKLTLDDKPLGYPLDRPVDELYFFQPNMFVKDVFIYHEGEENVFRFNTPQNYQFQDNTVTKN